MDKIYEVPFQFREEKKYYRRKMIVFLINIVVHLGVIAYGFKVMLNMEEQQDIMLSNIMLLFLILAIFSGYRKITDQWFRIEQYKSEVALFKAWEKTVGVCQIVEIDGYNCIIFDFNEAPPEKDIMHFLDMHTNKDGSFPLTLGFRMSDSRCKKEDIQNVVIHNMENLNKMDVAYMRKVSKK